MTDSSVSSPSASSSQHALESTPPTSVGSPDAAARPAKRARTDAPAQVKSKGKGKGKSTGKGNDIGKKGNSGAGKGKGKVQGVKKAAKKASQTGEGQGEGRVKVEFKQEEDSYNPHPLEDRKPDTSYPRHLSREPPADRLLDLKQEEDVKPVIVEASVQARQAALATDYDPDRKPQLGPAPVPKDHPKAANLRAIHRDPFPDHPGPAEGVYEAVCNELALAHFPNKPGTARDKWPVFRADDITDHSILYGLVDGILSVTCNWRKVYYVMERLPRMGESEAGWEARKARAPGLKQWLKQLKENPALIEGVERLDWRKIMGWDLDTLTLAIKEVGYNTKKANYIKLALTRVDKWQRSIGHPADAPLSLGFVRREESNDKCLEIYFAFKGVGLATAMNEMGWRLGRDVLAVDNNAHRMALLLGWIPFHASPDNAARHLNARVPKHLRFALHQLFWEHAVSCKRCAVKGQTSEKAPFTEAGTCPIEERVDREAMREWEAKVAAYKAKKAEEAGVKQEQEQQAEGETVEADEEADESDGSPEAEVEAAISAAVEADDDSDSEYDEPVGKRRKRDSGPPPARRASTRLGAGSEGGAAVASFAAPAQAATEPALAHSTKTEDDETAESDDDLEIVGFKAAAKVLVID